MGRWLQSSVALTYVHPTVTRYIVDLLFTSQIYVCPDKFTANRHFPCSSSNNAPKLGPWHDLDGSLTTCTASKSSEPQALSEDPRFTESFRLLYYPNIHFQFASYFLHQQTHGSPFLHRAPSVTVDTVYHSPQKTRQRSPLSSKQPQRQHTLRRHGEATKRLPTKTTAQAAWPFSRRNIPPLLACFNPVHPLLIFFLRIHATKTHVYQISPLGCTS